MVSYILAGIAEGDSPESVMANFHLEPEDIQGTLFFAADPTESLSGMKSTYLVRSGVESSI